MTTNTTYTSIEQRMFHTYAETLPPFHPTPAIPHNTQQAFYNFLRTLYTTLTRQPELLCQTLHPNGVYRNRFNAASDHNPKLYTHMKAGLQKAESLLAAMLAMGIQGRVQQDALLVPSSFKCSKSHLAALSAAGLTYERTAEMHCFTSPTQGLFEAWQWLALQPVQWPHTLTPPRTSLLLFSRAIFDQEHPYMGGVFRPLLGNSAAFDRLIAYLEQHNYTRLENREDTITLDYVKEHDKKPSIVKGPWSERTHSGIGMQYDYKVAHSACFALRVPMHRRLLACFDHMPAPVQAFVANHNKKCDGCNYCIQTDKTGKRPMIYTQVRYAGEDIKLCPLYPGYNYVWETIDDALAEGIIGFLDFIDETLSKG